MKRLVVTTLIIGAAVTVVVAALHATHALAALEAAVAGMLSDYAGATRVVGEKWHYLFMLLIAAGAAWLSLKNDTPLGRTRVRLLSGAFLIELLALSWVCSLYRVFFQPVPSILALALALVAAEGWTTFLRRNRSHLLRTLFADRLANEELRRLSADGSSFDLRARTYEVSVVVCNIASRRGFTANSEPAIFADAMARFIRQSADAFLRKGAYLHAADGEGVVAFFGFPFSTAKHAEEAVCAVLDLAKSLRGSSQNARQSAVDWQIHAGISSGTIIAGSPTASDRPSLLASGLPIDLARRFCALNHRYGSTVLIDTATYDQVSDTVVARPIDFVSGLNSQDRLEIYQPLWLAAEAKPEHIARRDSFWSGVVLYREKRWAEAYSEFQKARSAEGEEDPPLEFYLRRLEPLLLKLSEAPHEPGPEKPG
jgi:class 3 adenylate cyclase